MTGVRTLQMQGHHGQRGAGRSTLRFSRWAARAAALGVRASSLVDFVGVAVAAQGGQERVGGVRGGDGFGGEEGGQTALPALVLAFDFALGLGRARVAQRDAVEVAGRAKLGERGGTLGEEEAVAIDAEFAGQAVLGESGGQEVEVSQEVFAGINGGAGADARAVVEQVEQRVVFLVPGEPTVRGGVELPERADLQALPAAHRGGRTRRGRGMSQLLGDGPATDGGRIDFKVEAAMDFGGGAAVGGRRLGREQFAQQRFNAGRPVGGMIAAGGAGRPLLLLVVGEGAEIVAADLVEAGAAAAGLLGGGGGGDLVAAEGGEDFTDQWGSEAVGELAVVFFMAARMAEWSGPGERGAPALRACRRPALRSGLRQARRAGSVHLCSHSTVHL